MYFLIDTNLSSAVVGVFKGLGFQSEYVNDNAELRNQSDEVIFELSLVSPRL